MPTGPRAAVERMALAAGLLLSWTSLAPAAATSPDVAAVRRPALMDSTRVAAMIRALQGARSARVEHAVWRTRPIHFATTRPCVYSSRRPPSIALLDAAAAARFVGALGLDRRPGFGEVEPSGFCARDSARRDDLTLTFTAGHSEIAVSLYPDQGFVQFRWSDQSSPLLSLRGRGEDLRRALFESLPGDSSLRRLSWCGFGSSDWMEAASFGPGVVVDSLPGVLDQSPPDYPQSVQDAGVDGTVEILIQVGLDGTVRSTEILGSIPMLDQQAVQAVERWSFTPARWHGRPASVWVALPVTFTLH